MAAKSIVYIGIFGGLGYVLMKLSEPSEEKKKAISGYHPDLTEAKAKKALFLQKLKESSEATSNPTYLKKAAQEPQQPSKREIN